MRYLLVRASFFKLLVLAAGITLLAYAGAAPSGAAFAQTASVPTAPQNDDFWDGRFGPVDIGGTVRTMAVAANGDVYIGGLFYSVGGVDVNNIARWDGRRWHALGTGVNGDVRNIAISGNDVYVVGTFTSAGAAIARDIARWNGTAWAAVGNGSGAADTGLVETIAISGNHVYIGGDFEEFDGVAARHIAHWNGAQWAPLGQGLADLDFEETELTDFGAVYALWIDGPNAVYAGGMFTGAGHNNTVIKVNHVAFWNGSQWQALGGGMGDDPYETRVDMLFKDGANLYVGGEFTRAGGQAANNIARWDGGAWHPLGSGITPADFAYRPVRAMAKIGNWFYVGGEFLGAGGQTATNLARWNGNAWERVGTLDGTVDALAVDGAGYLLALGGFQFIDDFLLEGVGRWQDGIWRSLGEGVSSSPGVVGEVRAAAVDAAGRVYIGGRFTYAGSTAARNLAMWDGDRWHNIGDVDQPVDALVIGGNMVYIGGDFSQAGTINANRVAMWNRQTQTWAALGNGINGPVNALDYEDGILYAGGVFTAAGTVAAYDVAWWDGAAWHAFGTKIRIYEPGAGGGEYPTIVYALDAQGTDVVIGGQFQTVQNTGDGSLILVNNVVLWNRAEDEWYRVGQQTPTEEPGVTVNGATGALIQANAVALVGDNVYVGGNFNQAGTVAAGGMARWSYGTNTWSGMGGGVGGFSGAQVDSLLWADGLLYVGGSFTSAGNAAARYIAAYAPAGGGTWSALGTGITPHFLQYLTHVYDIVRHGNALYVVGNFTAAGGKPSLAIGRYAPPEPVWTDFVYVPLVVR